MPLMQLQVIEVAPPVSSTNKTDHHDITEILLKVALNTINPNPQILNIIILLLKKSFPLYCRSL
jgi:hypothetical protein